MISTKSPEKLNKNDLKNYFISGSKQTETIGIEYEKIGVTENNFRAVPYEKMEYLLEKLSGFKEYKKIFNNTQNENIIGLKNDFSNISLEPGSQFEVSLNPQTELSKLDEQIKNHNELTKNIADELGIIWLGTGLQPVSTFNDIKIIPKKRYELMSKYLPKVANLPLVMMRETAGIQTTIDYKDENDAIEKLRLSLQLSPVIGAVFANSPIRNGKLSGFKSFRLKSWTDTDNQRCGLISKKIFDTDYDFNIDDYTDIVCDVQMIMISRDNRISGINNFTFNDYLKNGYCGKMPDINDFEQHLSLFFTDVRLKKYLEIRNHDSQKAEYIMCVPAFWKGVMYNKTAREELKTILNYFRFEDFEDLRQTVPNTGLDCKLGHYELKDIAKIIFEIAYNSLKTTGEEKYLEPILELVNEGITPADIIIKNFNGMWHGNIEKFINFSRI